MVPEIRYARSGDLHIAYWEFGDGPIDLLWVPTWIWESEYIWEEPYTRRMFERLSNFARVITFDRRGAGMSDPVPRAPTLEEQMDDVVAVMNAVGSEEAAVLAMLEAAAMPTLFAATHPERTRALVVYEGMARMSKAPDYDWPLSRDERDALASELQPGRPPAQMGRAARAARREPGHGGGLLSDAERGGRPPGAAVDPGTDAGPVPP